VIMPGRLAKPPYEPFTPIKELIGSGPYRFKADERVPGERTIYERFSVVNAARIFLKTAEVNFPSVGGQPLARSWLFFGGRPRRLGIGAGVGGAMTALERTCSGINSACCRSR